MARISAKTLSFEPSPSPDVTGYRMYFMPTGEPVDYTSPFIELDTSLSYDLSKFEAMASLDGEFDVAFSAVDDAGNESDLGSLVVAVPLDFNPPVPPENASFA